MHNWLRDAEVFLCTIHQSSGVGSGASFEDTIPLLLGAVELTCIDLGSECKVSKEFRGKPLILQI